MKIFRLRIFTILALALLALPASAQDFVIEQRQIQVDHDALYDLLGDDLYGETETVIARQIFSMPIEDFLERAGQDVEITTTKIYITEGYARMGEDAEYAIINLETGAMQMVNTLDRVYMEWTSQDTEDMQAQMESMMQDAGFSAEDLELMQQQMMEDEEMDAGDMDIGEAIGDGKSAEINGRRATSHESNSYGTVTVTWCSNDEPGLATAFKKMIENSAMLMMDEETSEPDEVVCEDGVPVREQTYDAMGNSYVIDDMLSVSRQSVSDDMFRIPAGFTKQKLPF